MRVLWVIFIMKWRNCGCNNFYEGKNCEIWRKTQIGVLIIKISQKCLIFFGNVFKIVCTFFALKFKSLEPIFWKLAYKDNTHYWPITRLLIGLKTFINKLSARWVFWHNKRAHRHQNDCLIAITRFSMTFLNLQVLEISGIVEFSLDNFTPINMNLS